MARHGASLWPSSKVLGRTVLIFATVGTHPLGFERFLIALESAVSELAEDVVVQTGVSTYVPKHATAFPFAASAVMRDYVLKARLVVCPGAMTGREALLAERAVVIFPRLRKYGEVIDDHQVDLAERFMQLYPHSVRVALDAAQLRDALRAQLLPPDTSECLRKTRQLQSAVRRLVFRWARA